MKENSKKDKESKIEGANVAERTFSVRRAPSAENLKKFLRQQDERPDFAIKGIMVFDIGGTHMRAAFSADGKNLEPLIMRDTPQDFEMAKKAFGEMMEEASKGRPAQVISVALAGVHEDGKVIRSPNLKGWEGRDIFATIRGFAPSARIILENDAVAAGLAEAREGAGKGFDIVAYITVGTGVGGARFVGGEIDKRAYGFEPGQEIIDAKSGATFESLASGKSIERKYGKNMSKIEDAATLDEIAMDFAAGLRDIISIWSPEILVMGGIAMAESMRLFALIQKRTKESVEKVFPSAPDIKLAAFGDESGLRGALLLARRHAGL